MAKLSTKRIPKFELLVYQEELKEDIFRQIRMLFNRLEITQKDLAQRLGVDEGALSRRLRGQNDMQLETFSDLARGLGCRIKVTLSPLKELREVVGERKIHFYDMLQGFHKPEDLRTDTVEIRRIEVGKEPADTPLQEDPLRKQFDTDHQSGDASYVRHQGRVCG